ncbi:aldo/keto reductase [Ponticoccus sp. SC2-23]|uniref:aldo/keto reductase n=1 Tax=Alexandriicola marinus TaxID=2081710 RepID=UPI000FDB7929|nr:aldo/keto reductase [Alexandriicola marinus]MBM1221379.1 aldo/keto reductase [Ponticoccus sp. SC6-9]MBM1226420.1 aldo/keto reductase [Ponticoccus sp. SC6-15]MBM1230371.1 aldo/keto reductase [Ponticoccus sp. SC6-38]MBM1234894.1 aldo/keto reductase [Ponticoccus sp. SC6-45]MBM1239392.1 aldo/keto reductase [Ponticoccus sp. SC6-49]MBM1243174.1 aldo/keto reductase [Ponticoccus sp. SC2-64]MBM1248418.1 aldo/keto reductase [Ponticoccus sp. SC6-42]MBM1253003.1 aldo/keto reductase [Ponticoccus sp. 
MNVETAELRPGHTISRVIKGGWQLAGDHGEVRPEQAIADMEAFLDAGITTFDCADIYTGVEEMIGHFIADVRNRRGSDIANRVVVHTKLVPDLGRLSDIRPDEVEAIVDRSLRRLRIERIPLVQFFWWDMATGNAVEALEVLKECQRKGKIANLGTTNWDTPVMDKFCDAGFDVVSAQVQYSVLDRRPAGAFSDWTAQRDVQILAYGTLAGGFLTDVWLDQPDPGYAFENRSLIKYRLIIDEFGPWDLFQELLRTLKAVGDKHGVALSTVATRWVLDQPRVAAAIVGARYARHLPKTLEVFGLTLDAEDNARIGGVLAQSNGPSGPVYGLEGDRNGRHGRIMKYNLNTNPGDKVHGA